MTQDNESEAGVAVLRRFLEAKAPVVALLGQKAGWHGATDQVLEAALDRAGVSGSSWPAILNAGALPPKYYEWVAERFQRRVPSAALEMICSAPFSAVFTSSIDPGLANMLASDGREPEMVLLGTPQPRVLRSFRRPPIYYLFGRAGAGAAEMLPPLSSASLAQRRVRHSTAMLRNLDETATPLGLIVIDGFDPSADWLRSEDVLAVISAAPKGGVLWCGNEPVLSPDDATVYQSLLESGIIIRDARSLAELLIETNPTLVSDPREAWGEPELVSLAEGKRLVITPRLRLITQASASIIDDSWAGFLSPLGRDEEQVAFHSFHGNLGGTRLTFDGIRRGFAMQRDFEQPLWDRVSKALSQHHLEEAATILHGQSGVGKSIALARLALRARESGAAVLFAHGRLPQAGDVSDFLQSVDQVEGITLLIADATVPAHRYDDLLRSLRSAGHRAVVVGSSYRIEQQSQVAASRLVEVPALLSGEEQKGLMQLVSSFAPEATRNLQTAAGGDYALARFYRLLPESRGRISEGLGREARLVEHELGTRGARPRAPKPRTALGEALAEAGFGIPATGAFAVSDPTDQASPASRVIDFVMAASRLFKNIPVGLVLRAVAADQADYAGVVDVNLIVELFQDQDIFRWKYGDEEGADLLIGARLQIEAEIVCNRRLGGPRAEAEAILDLIGCAYRAGPDDNDETRFVADIVQAMGPDGPAGDRYRDQYAEIARTLTRLRDRTGVMNGRLMLQESALRRAFVRTHDDLTGDDKAKLLIEATEAVDGALQAIQEGSHRIYASRRNKEHLWVERAATYGFLATDSAQRANSTQEVWSSYKAAREATRMAAGRVDSYLPLDIALWIPVRILREATALDPTQALELKADLWSTLDLVDASSLDPTQYEMFQRQRLSVAEVLKDSDVGDEAFDALERAGSTVGYYLRARSTAPRRDRTNNEISEDDLKRATQTVTYIRQHYHRVSTDARMLQLLLRMEWLTATKRWLFSGLRQPLPSVAEGRARIKGILLDLALTHGEVLQPRYRYLEAVLTWIDGSEDIAIRIWRELDNDTKFVEAGRILARHVLTDEAQQPRVFSGIVERQIGQDRWSLYIEPLNRRIDALSASFQNEDLAVGRTVRNFAISFNYRGPLADRIAARFLGR